jgi:hypothetical protein
MLQASEAWDPDSHLCKASLFLLVAGRARPDHLGRIRSRFVESNEREYFEEPFNHQYVAKVWGSRVMYNSACGQPTMLGIELGDN